MSQIESSFPDNIRCTVPDCGAGQTCGTKEPHERKAKPIHKTSASILLSKVCRGMLGYSVCIPPTVQAGFPVSDAVESLFGDVLAPSIWLFVGMDASEVPERAACHA